MTSAIEIDPKTGLKTFHTRAAVAEGISPGTGYAVLDDDNLKKLPKPPPGAKFNAIEEAEYRAFKNARFGAANFVSMEGEFATYLQDVYSAKPVERQALADTCDVLVVGAGFAGLLLWYKLSQAGFRDVRFCEKGGDVGGTWYWNRYPGIACDVESYSYMPLLEEMGYIPTMKFASGYEIFEYCQSIAERFGFYERCLFHTTVEKTTWNEVEGRWTIETDRGDAMRARYVVLANGILTAPRLARIEGMETFKGSVFHTSRWNYGVDLTGKRVGVIGTGATAVQVVPELAKVVGELYVFQRTPSSVDVRDQRATTPEEFEKWSNDPTWAQARRKRLAKISSGRAALQGNDDFLAGRVEDFKERKKYAHELTSEELIEKQLHTNFRIMEQIRARVDALVEDPETAAVLKPYYPYGCKRPTFHDEFLTIFNQSHVQLVDTAPRGVRRINQRGVVHNGLEYPLDVLIYATGFEWMGTSCFNMVTGRNGKTLYEKWEHEGTKTYLGLHCNGFPNLFIISGPQGGGGQFNFIRIIEAHTDYVTWMMKTMRARGANIVDVKKESEETYASHCREVDIKTSPLRDCISYYNGEGKAEPGSLAYYGGPEKWHEIRRVAQQTLDAYVFEPEPRETLKD